MFALLLACGTQEAAVAIPMTSPAALTFEEGPLLADTAALRAWLEAGGSRVVLVPVHLGVDALALTDAHIGALPVRLDDTALGVSLHDRVRGVCSGATCTILVEGRWGALMGGEGDTLAVTRFVGLADPAITKAQGAR